MKTISSLHPQLVYNKIQIKMCKCIFRKMLYTKSALMTCTAVATALFSPYNVYPVGTLEMAAARKTSAHLVRADLATGKDRTKSWPETKYTPPCEKANGKP